MAFGEITNCKLNFNSVNVFSEEGMVNLELGDPAGENQAHLGANGAYAICDTLESSHFPNARITVLSGSMMEDMLNQLANSTNYGSETSMTLIKNYNKSSGMGKEQKSYKLCCVKTPGVPTNYSVVDNSGDVGYTYFNIDIYLLDSAVI